MKRTALILGCAVAVMATAAFADDRIMSRHHGGDGFEIDSNADGWITRAEASAAADRMFAALDHDNDGRLTAEDRRARHVELRLDGERQRTGRHARRDAERTARHAERDAERHVERTVIIHRGGEPPEAAAPPTPPRAPRPPMFIMAIANGEEADLNGDGALSLDEFRAQQLRFFDASDANGDGRIRFEPPPAPPEPPTPPTPPTRLR